jgi:putative transposase
MNFLPGELYHIYNQGNNKQLIFFSQDNYLYFLKKIRKHILPFCDLLAVKMSLLSNGFRILESSYARAINKQESRTGSIFQQNTKLELLTTKSRFSSSNSLPLACFRSIHQAPMTSGLAQKMDEWEFSSFNEYMGKASENLCNRILAFNLLNLSSEIFYKECYSISNLIEL